MSHSDSASETVRLEKLLEERRKIAAEIAPILKPRSIAVLGASRDPDTIGGTMLANLIRRGFKGELYPVNPKADVIQGLKCYPSVGAIGKPVDLAIILVPAALVKSAVTECALARVGGLVIISAGFAEVSPDRRALEKELVEIAHKAGMRLVGPNCLGVVNLAPDVSMNGSFVDIWPPFGNIGILSQSGALGAAILDYARVNEIGISSFVSVGNKADVSGNPVLCYWAEDPNTDVIALYLESFGNPRRFARIAPEIARKKPIVAVKSGRSTAGSRAASSHSAALASLDVAVDALFEQVGVIRTDTLEELFDVVSLLSSQPIPHGKGVAVITNAGGPGILLADALEARGLQLPEFQGETLQKLKAFLPPQAACANPVDMIASATAEQFGKSLRIAAADPNIDSIIVIYIPVLKTLPHDVAAELSRAALEIPENKPLQVVFLSAQRDPSLVLKGRKGPLPCYSFPENAANALAAVERYGRWRRRPRGKCLATEERLCRELRAVIDPVLAGRQDRFWLEPKTVEKLLGLIGIASAASAEVSAAEAALRADKLGYPLAAKVISRDIIHKSDAGCVKLNLRSRADVERAVVMIQDNALKAGGTVEGILLQRMIEGELEALVGVSTDPLFGPLIVCGMGGVLVEVLKDASFRMPPVSDEDAREMIDSLRCRRLLDGYRGAKPGDRAALEEILMKVSLLVEIVPEIREMDLNPIKLLEPGKGAIVVDARIRVGVS